jgi:aminoglycoside phosphotransferase (APT) family kinase protein
MTTSASPGEARNALPANTFDDIHARLSAWATAAHPGSVVGEVARLAGNSGLSFSFELSRAGAPSERLVIRLAPPSVRRRGNTDVLRQVPLLRALEGAHVPVARVRWAESESTWFGTDAVIQEFVDGRPLHLHDARLSVRGERAEMETMVTRAIETLVAIHSLDWSTTLASWSKVRGVQEELAFWDGLRDRMAESQWSDQAHTLGEQLRIQAPEHVAVGLIHGDYQMNNVLFSAEHELLAVIDWELAGVGPQELDLGWFSVMTDPTCWHADYSDILRLHLDPLMLVEIYEQAGGLPVSRFNWWRALACFRFGVIAGFNLRLHRTGKRLDPLYEDLVPSVPVLFSRGLELLDSAECG